MNKCEHGWTNFSASFRIVALKLTKSIRSELPKHSFTSISYVPLFAEWRHHEQSFSFQWACMYFFLVYILYERWLFVDSSLWIILHKVYRLRRSRCKLNAKKTIAGMSCEQWLLTTLMLFDEYDVMIRYETCLSCLSGVQQCFEKKTMRFIFFENMKILLLIHIIHIWKYYSYFGY